jgi:predicted  nucleic acid-binding Zn-ribbon protein
MKQIALFLIIAVSFFACGGNSDSDMQATIDSLQEISAKKDASINDFMKSYNEIQANLETIKEKERIISLKAHGDVELDESAKDKINDDILAIYELMKKNKETIAKLENKLKKSNIKASEFQKMIARLEEDIRNKDQQIESLKNDLAKLNFDIVTLNAEIAKMNENIDTLQEEISEKEDVIISQDQKLHTAYYVYGTKKELKEHKIITSEGGFIGLGRMQKLMENFNKDYFKVIDTKKTTSIPLFSKKAQLITSHPASSYYFAGKDKIDSLVIKKQDDFWSVSKYLVIMVE